MTQTLIKWRLREIMARYRIKGIELAQEIGISTNAVSNLRNSETMPRIDGQSLNNLCNALNKLALNPEREITPNDLIEYTRDLDPEHTLDRQSSSASSSKKKQNPYLEDTINDPRTKLTIILGDKPA